MFLDFYTILRYILKNLKILLPEIDYKALKRFLVLI